MSYHNLAKYWNGDHILYTIYDIVLPASYFFKQKLKNLVLYHCRTLCIDFKIRQQKLNNKQRIYSNKPEINHSIDQGRSSNNF